MTKHDVFDLFRLAEYRAVLYYLLGCKSARYSDMKRAFDAAKKKADKTPHRGGEDFRRAITALTNARIVTKHKKEYSLQNLDGVVEELQKTQDAAFFASNTAPVSPVSSSIRIYGLSPSSFPKPKITKPRFKPGNKRGVSRLIAIVRNALRQPRSSVVVSVPFLDNVLVSQDPAAAASINYRVSAEDIFGSSQHRPLHQVLEKITFELVDIKRRKRVEAYNAKLDDYCHSADIMYECKEVRVIFTKHKRLLARLMAEEDEFEQIVYHLLRPRFDSKLSYRDRHSIYTTNKKKDILRLSEAVHALDGDWSNLLDSKECSSSKKKFSAKLRMIFDAVKRDYAEYFPLNVSIVCHSNRSTINDILEQNANTSIIRPAEEILRFSAKMKTK